MARKKPTPAPPVPGPGGEQPAGRFPPRWLILTLACLVLVVAILALAGQKAGAVFITFNYWIFVIPVVAAAAMLGLFLTEPFDRRQVFDHSPWPRGYRLLTAIALGLGTFSLGTLGLATIHLVEPDGMAWPLLAIPLAGAVLGYRATRRFAVQFDRSVFTARAHRGEWLFVLAAVPLAALFIMASFPPGSLFVESQGYDVLEYHLELPREYALNNSSAPVTHNVYSFFPANVEMLYLLEMQFAKCKMGSDRETGYVWGAFPAQYLHSLLMLLAAAAIALFPIGAKPAAGAEADSATPKDARWFGATGRAMAVLLFLGVPWTVITGALAYNEGGMLLFGTLALGAAITPAGAADRRARPLLVGVLLGLAVGCKMTAGVFFALPVAMIYILRAGKDRSQIRALVTATAVAAAVYAPWAIRAAMYSGGNPLFPLATALLPRDHWTAEQAVRFSKGHAPPTGIATPVGMVRQLVGQSVLDARWSIQPYAIGYFLLRSNEGAGPDVAAPWYRIGLLWVALPLALAGAFITRSGRSSAKLLLGIAGLQILMWILATHQQARFLLPTAVPLALLAGRGVQGLHGARETIHVAALRIVTGTLVAVHALGVVFAMLAVTELLGGVMSPRPAADRLDPPVGELFSRVFNLAQVLEHPKGDVLVPPRKVLLIGEDWAWLYEGEVDYFTTFDSHPFVLALADPKRAVAWLRENHVRYVVVNWLEIERLRKTYGFAPAVTRESIAALVEAGAEEVRQQLLPNKTILRVPE
jgi:hypothetical protein